MGSDEASGAGDEDAEAGVSEVGYEDNKGWSQKEKREGKRSRDKREKKINKIINASAIVTVHICIFTVAIMHLCTFLHPLMWVFFWSKCVNEGFFAFCMTLHPLIWLLLF